MLLALSLLMHGMCMCEERSKSRGKDVERGGKRRKRREEKERGERAEGGIDVE